MRSGSLCSGRLCIRCRRARVGTSRNLSITMTLMTPIAPIIPITRKITSYPICTLWTTGIQGHKPCCVISIRLSMGALGGVFSLIGTLVGFVSKLCPPLLSFSLPPMFFFFCSIIYFCLVLVSTCSFMLGFRSWLGFRSLL